MYKRFRDGLLGPRDVLTYIGDKWYHVLLQLLLFVILMCIPFVINAFTKNPITHDFESQVKNDLNGAVIPFHTENGVLVKNDGSEVEEFTYVYNSALKIRLSISGNTADLSDIEILITSDTVYYCFGGIRTKIGTFKDQFLELANFDFSKLGSYNNTLEWDTLFSCINKNLKEFNKKMLPMSLIMNSVSNLIMILIFTLIMSGSFFIRFSRFLKFGALFKISVYYITPLVVGDIVYNIFAMRIFLYIGVVLSMVYSIIGQNSLIKKIYSNGRE